MPSLPPVESVAEDDDDDEVSSDVDAEFVGDDVPVLLDAATATVPRLSAHVKPPSIVPDSAACCRAVQSSSALVARSSAPSSFCSDGKATL